MAVCVQADRVIPLGAPNAAGTPESSNQEADQGAPASCARLGPDTAVDEGLLSPSRTAIGWSTPALCNVPIYKARAPLADQNSGGSLFANCRVMWYH